MLLLSLLFVEKKKWGWGKGRGGLEVFISKTKLEHIYALTLPNFTLSKFEKPPRGIMQHLPTHSLSKRASIKKFPPILIFQPNLIV
jgi:hypothetical protein